MQRMIRDTVIFLLVYVIFFVSPVREVMDPLPRFQRGVIFLSLATIIAGIAILWRNFLDARLRRRAMKIADWYGENVQKKRNKKKKGVK